MIKSINKSFVASAIIFFAASCASGLTEQCLKKDVGRACFEKGTNIFMGIDQVKSFEEGEEIKREAARWFERGCKRNHKESCEELKSYQAHLDGQL